MSPVVPFAELVASTTWRTVDLVSDLHLQASEPATLDAWLGYLRTTPADALFILGDLFEVWVGDDAAAVPGFEADCAAALREAAARRAVFFMHGNRDFLVGPALAAQCGFTLLGDPTVLTLHGERWLLSHGDLLCLDDVEYLRFRDEVRGAPWQRAFLAHTLEERWALGRQIRDRSEARKRDPGAAWADVDASAARDWLRRVNARTLVHGHTHHPATHDLGDGLRRIVLSDWDVAGERPRAQVLCLSAAGAQRVDLR
ncbi:MAG: UDP-2,3-diacylglucosamine hydrolase [Variovorax sp.]|nr:UDP-2,3-diacylglucosamine hydrolase [Variovorax sp.]